MVKVIKRKKNLDFSFINENSMLEFQNTICELREQCDSYVEAIASYCEDHSLDVDEIVSLISDSLKKKMYEEGIVTKRIKSDSPILPFQNKLI